MFAERKNMKDNQTTTDLVGSQTKLKSNTEDGTVGSKEGADEIEAVNRISRADEARADKSRADEAIDHEAENNPYADGPLGVDNISKKDARIENEAEMKSGFDLKASAANLRERKNYFIMGARYVEDQIKRWSSDERALKEKYPEFSLENAIKEPIFIKMLSIGMSIEQAYRSINFDSILREEMERAHAEYNQGIKARGSRPDENGVTGSGGVAMRSGVNYLSRNQRADIAKRAFNGEKITF